MTEITFKISSSLEYTCAIIGVVGSKFLTGGHSYFLGNLARWNLGGGSHFLLHWSGGSQ